MLSEISSTRVLEIFRNLGYEIVDTNAGPAIVFSSHNAFIFSLVTGSSYLDDDNFPFTAKGLTKVFNQVFSSIPVWGLFDGKNFGFTPRNIAKIRPYIFEGPKFIIPVDIENEDDSRQWIKQSRKSLKSPENFVFLRVENWKNGNGMEPLMEYLACHTFRKFGYFVENQIPLTATSGSPDFLAYSGKAVLSSASDFLDFEIQGFHVVELALLSTVSELDLDWPFHYGHTLSTKGSCIVGEAKVGGSSPKIQLEKYSATEFFSHQIALMDTLPTNRDLNLNYLYISSDNLISILDSTLTQERDSSELRIKDYVQWNEYIAKCYLLVNLNEDRLIDVCQEHLRISFDSPVEALLQIASDLTTPDIFRLLTANV
jgi:hypothetical protein